MKARVGKTSANTSKSLSPGILTRPVEAVAQARLQQMANASPGARQLNALQRMADTSFQSQKTRQLQAQSSPEAVAQLAKIKSHFGTWETKKYVSVAGRRMVGADIDLEFMPNFRCPDKDRIGLIQTVKNTVDGKPFVMEGLQTDVALTADDSAAHEGMAIDRFDVYGVDKTANNPVYGSESDEKDAVPARALYDLKNTPDKTAGNQLGFYNAGGTISVSAKLSDGPKMDQSSATSQVFETAAMILTGPRQGEFLGSVSWGYHAKEADVALDAFELVSEGNPSASYILAAKKWNEDGKKAGNRNGGGSDLIKIPLSPEL